MSLSESPSHRFNPRTGWAIGWLMDFRLAAIAQDEPAMREILLETATYDPGLHHSCMTLGMISLEEYARPRGTWEQKKAWLCEVLRELADSLEQER